MERNTADSQVQPAEETDAGLQLTHHAWRRIFGRGLPANVVEVAVRYGRKVYTRGACIIVIGRREVKRAGRKGVDLEAYEGAQVVCSPEGSVLTVYRNRDFSGLRPSRRRHSRRAA